MLTATEVASVWHVKEALKYEVDILWIGARTTANPFAVQEIADALRGYDIPVFVKNPINPDIELWIGALERFNKQYPEGTDNTNAKEFLETLQGAISHVENKQ